MEAIVLDARIFGWFIDEAEVLIVGFSVDETNEEHLVIQHSEMDSHDASGGKTSYYFELSKRGGASDCVSRVVLRENRIHFFMNEKGYRQFSTNEVALNLAFSEDDRRLARAYIILIFTNKAGVELQVDQDIDQQHTT